MTDIFVQEYSPKSFVVRGETKEYKDSLKAMGGKWNNSLTDKDSNDKFGAWLFWNDKRKEINDWFANGCPTGCSSTLQPMKTLNKDDNTIKRLEAKIDILTKMIETLCKSSTKQIDSDIESDSDEPPVKPKRLLSVRAR